MYNSGRRYSEPIHMGYTTSQSFYEDLFNAPVPGTDILGTSAFSMEDSGLQSFRIRTPKNDQSSAFTSGNGCDFNGSQMIMSESDLPAPWLTNHTLPLKYTQRPLSP